MLCTSKSGMDMDGKAPLFGKKSFLGGKYFSWKIDCRKLNFLIHFYYLVLQNEAKNICFVPKMLQVEQFKNACISGWSEGDEFASILKINGEGNYQNAFFRWIKGRFYAIPKDLILEASNSCTIKTKKTTQYYMI